MLSLGEVSQEQLRATLQGRLDARRVGHANGNASRRAAAIATNLRASRGRTTITPPHAGKGVDQSPDGAHHRQRCRPLSKLRDCGCCMRFYRVSGHCARHASSGSAFLVRKTVPLAAQLAVVLQASAHAVLRVMG